MEKYIVSVAFVVLIILVSVYIDKYKDEKEDTNKYYMLVLMLLILLLGGGYYVYDQFFIQPAEQKKILSQFLQIPDYDY